MADTPYAIELQRRTAEQRAVFEQAVAHVKEVATRRGLRPPACYISFTTGNPIIPSEDERVRQLVSRLHEHISSAGIAIGSPPVQEQGPGSRERILLACTPLYMKRIEHRLAEDQPELELRPVQVRLEGTADQRESLVPLLVSGNERSSLPLVLRGVPYFDFRNDTRYFSDAFDLLLSLYGIRPDDSAIAEARLSVRVSVYGDVGGEAPELPEFDAEELKASLVRLGERIRKEAFDAGRPIVILKNDKPTWIFPDGSERVGNSSNGSHR